MFINRKAQACAWARRRPQSERVSPLSLSLSLLSLARFLALDRRAQSERFSLSCLRHTRADNAVRARLELDTQVAL